MRVKELNIGIYRITATDIDANNGNPNVWDSYLAKSKKQSINDSMYCVEKNGAIEIYMADDGYAIACLDIPSFIYDPVCIIKPIDIEEKESWIIEFPEIEGLKTNSQKFYYFEMKPGIKTNMVSLNCDFVGKIYSEVIGTICNDWGIISQQ